MNSIEDNKQFCFIISISDELYKEQCLKYLGTLDVPEGYTTDVITIEGADRLSAAYNAGMQASPAKYKIYMEQELLIYDRRFLYELLEVFSDPHICMTGLIGAQVLSGDGEIRNSDCVGTWGEEEDTGSGFYWYGDRKSADAVCDVLALDKRLVATQEDLQWREDLFSGDSYLVTAQSLEYIRAGSRVVVMPMQCTGGAYLYDKIFFQTPKDESDRKSLLKEYDPEITGGTPRTRILYTDVGLVSAWNIPYALAANEMDVVLHDYEGSIEQPIRGDIDRVSADIKRLHPDAVMTHDYYVPVSLACAENDIPYIAWIYDSLQVALYDESVRLPGRYIFDFDRLQAEDTRQRGAAYIRHFPLASNPYLSDTLEIDGNDEKRFACDISFIGSLYEGYEIPVPLETFDRETQAEIRGLWKERIGVWDGEVRFADRLSDRAIEEIVQKAFQGKTVYDRKLIGDRKYIEETYLSRGVSRMERIEALRRLGTLDADVRLYTTESGQNMDIPGVKINGVLSYNEELPKAYYLSRINLNFTLPSIRSGVPLRVFDILSAGGFLLTNDQPEMGELFEVGKDLEVFHSFDEMVDKADYYLKHEKERLQIALNGHRKVRERYSYDLQVRRILEMVSDDLEQKGGRRLI